MIIRKIRLTEYEYQPPINYVAGATEPDIQFQLADYTIPAGATARCYVQRFDGTFEYTVATIDGNNVTVEPTSSMFSVRGEGAIQITLYAGEEVLKNFSVPVFVHADLADENAEQGSDVTGIFRAAEEQALEDFAEDAEAKAAEVIESIPADYTELTEEVDELNERLVSEKESTNNTNGTLYPIRIRTEKYWDAKTAVINGDSIARGNIYIEDDTPVTVDTPFGEYAFDKLGITLIENYAVGGATLCHGTVSVQDTLQTMDRSANVVLISAGTNDWATSKTLGEHGDTTIYTFYGALYFTLNYLTEVYEGKHVLFCTPVRRGLPGATNNNGNTLDEFRNAIVEMCLEFNVPVVDMYNESRIDPNTWPEVFYDGIHPLQIGHDMMGEYLSGMMVRLANHDLDIKDDYTVKGSFANMIYETLGLYVDENGDICQREDGV